MATIVWGRGGDAEDVDQDVAEEEGEWEKISVMWHEDETENELSLPGVRRAGWVSHVAHICLFSGWPSSGLGRGGSGGGCSDDGAEKEFRLSEVRRAD